MSDVERMGAAVPGLRLAAGRPQALGDESRWRKEVPTLVAPWAA